MARISRQSVLGAGESLGGLFQAIAQIYQRNKQLEQIEQARSRAFNPPVGVGGTSVDFNRRVTPDGAMLGTQSGNVSQVRNQAPLQPDFQMQGGGGNPEFLRTLLMLATGGNQMAKEAIPLQAAFLPKMESFGPGQMVGEVDPLTNRFTPKFQTPFAPPREYYGAPTQLQKHQDELAAIRAANPNDPRIPQYEAVIEKLQIGVPGYRFIEGPGGELIVADPKRGKIKGGSGQFTETPEAVNMQIRSLADIGESARNIKSVLSRGATGPVEGRARKVGTLFFNDKDQQALINYLGQLRPIIYGLSGKQINEAEQAWLDREILPRLEQPDENFGVTLNIFNQWVDRKLKSMKEQYPGAIIPSSAPKEGGITFDPNDFEQWRKNRK